MSVAASALAEFAPDVAAPESVRACGVRPRSRQVDAADLPTAVEEFVRTEAAREGNSVVIGPPGAPGAVTPFATEGLEFDAVLVVDPQRVLARGALGAGELYEPPTRAAQRLGVLHRDDELPPALACLAQAPTSPTER